MKNCCCIIPIYHETPTENELISIKRSLSILSDFDIFFIHPINMNTYKYQEFHNVNFVNFSAHFFKSNKTYSKLILSEIFYLPFLEYDYMLIAQTDTYILNTNCKLQDFISKGYDYWGAPWPNGPFFKPYSIKDRLKLLFIHHPENCHVGNGGFSLRRVMTAYHFVKKRRLYLKFLWHFNEDLFFSMLAYKSKYAYTTAPMHEAAAFALETNMHEEIAAGHVPYAVHAWEKYLSLDMLLKSQK